ncbi:hypothetical protein L1987_36168 [Smallanthus sonchifolius]|uniref:Uncharacterized protein n=1 Tax=Smallanthus sonchifolius TaxID=185202 RepID=A0ACB9HCU8_9ASTR|nr:hypothetical protein L1987_36168 [Smallanthus sonchifolius]
MAMRSVIISRSPPLLHFVNSRSPLRFFSDQGRMLDDEERARENLYVKKMEKEKLEKQKQKLEAKEKADKEKSDEKIFCLVHFRFLSRNRIDQKFLPHRGDCTPPPPWLPGGDGAGVDDVDTPLPCSCITMATSVVVMS